MATNSSKRRPYVYRDTYFKMMNRLRSRSVWNPFFQAFNGFDEFRSSKALENLKTLPASIRKRVEDFIRQSLRKKPYHGMDFQEMEDLWEGPPGLMFPDISSPDWPNPTTNIPQGPALCIFNLETDAKYCPNQTNTNLVVFSANESVIDDIQTTLTDDPATKIINKIGLGTISVSFDLVAGNETGPVTVEASMSCEEGLIGDSNVNIPEDDEENCVEEFVIFEGPMYATVVNASTMQTANGIIDDGGSEITAWPVLASDLDDFKASKVFKGSGGSAIAFGGRTWLTPNCAVPFPTPDCSPQQCVASIASLRTVPGGLFDTNVEDRENCVTATCSGSGAPESINIFFDETRIIRAAIASAFPSYPSLGAFKPTEYKSESFRFDLNGFTDYLWFRTDRVADPLTSVYTCTYNNQVDCILTGSGITGGDDLTINEEIEAPWGTFAFADLVATSSLSTSCSSATPCTIFPTPACSAAVATSGSCSRSWTRHRTAPEPDFSTSYNAYQYFNAGVYFSYHISVYALWSGNFVGSIPPGTCDVANQAAAQAAETKSGPFKLVTGVGGIYNDPDPLFNPFTQARNNSMESVISDIIDAEGGEVSNIVGSHYGS